MMSTQRRDLILEQLRQDGTVYTADLVKKLKVSSETIRKDLDYLEKEGRLVRVHGGAVPANPSPAGGGESEASPYISFHIRNTQNIQQKTAIAEYAASLVKEHQVVALDYGSTSQILAAALKDKFHALTIITNSVRNALILADNPGFTTILTGGILTKEEYSLVNDFAPITDYLHIDIFFMTVTGIDPAIGFTDLRLNEAKTQNQLRRSSDRTIVLADHSKFGKSSLARICSLREVDRIITDSELPEQIEQDIRRSGTELFLVEAGGVS